MEFLIKEEPPVDLEQDMGTTDHFSFSNWHDQQLDFEVAAEAMALLLQEWGLGILAERFAINLIDPSVLDYLVDTDIVELCRDLPMRYRLILRHKLSQKGGTSLRESNIHHGAMPSSTKRVPVKKRVATSYSSPTQLSIKNPGIAIPAAEPAEPMAHCSNENTKPIVTLHAMQVPTFPEPITSVEPMCNLFNIEKILCTAPGRQIINYYQANNVLDKVHRSKLLKMIIERLMFDMTPKDLNTTLFKKIHDGVVKIFPNEKKFRETYDLKLKSLKYSGNHRIKQSSQSLGTAEDSTEKDIPNYSEEEMQAAKQWLSEGRTPTEEIWRLWHVSYDIRIRDYLLLGGLQIGRICDHGSWPIITEPIGYELISSDFNRRFPYTGSLLDRWEVLAKKVIEYAHRHAKNQRYRSIIFECQHDEKPDEIKVAQLLCGFMIQGVVKQNFKPNYLEVERGFVHVVKVRTHS
ncbi:uncharacterized protein LOC129747226 isoform X2 [Uranotaenia lowii]|uniref:uncharacterized protein LOC129747226 isoform X2 n=1 Tax=Uranotaenia lowii TaxID=190385 RepID=UPI0024792A49|nr:uncharacterized protein LOC129747226 isoform X2 [Uranotaenia lowii]